jgi:hypothetical protein
MNYKIRITAENQAIVKRIADENRMNQREFRFSSLDFFYLISDNKFFRIVSESDYPELTTEQFVQIFDKKETEPHICKYCQAETTQDDETCYAKPTEWQPKRGDRVLVSNFNDNELEKIFVTKIEGAHYPIVAVHSSSENDFYNNLQFNTSCYKHMKPLPIEQPKETDFKTKVIELINEKINETTLYFEQQLTLKQYSSASQYEDEVSILDDLLIQIKEL